ncbi:hypothetical protein [Acetobacter lambici]|uniref:Filamentous haemagglutinin FhaB/tRNA nuclease CdiA-like TPS domain-containing protein n=1 Tax=Acetobacter lambici TaxID=1332824 RepID=A0ABT1F4C7_9PROT|nr:hypothetical protein [Acetobacter lambici]MCP1242362.1 hypothetical protein [Acetobacter lambici]MCP1258584.1 hypothetical protein [Acetobacter lambici]
MMGKSLIVFQRIKTSGLRFYLFASSLFISTPSFASGSATNYTVNSGQTYSVTSAQNLNLINNGNLSVATSGTVSGTITNNSLLSNSGTIGDLTNNSLAFITRGTTGNIVNLRALLEIRCDRFSRGFARDSKAGCGRQHNEAAWPELHVRRNAIRLI